jgi:hypothetical protein
MRLLARLVTTFTLLGGIMWCQAQHVHSLTEEEIGSVHFPTTCAKSTQASFSRAVALLHSFQYELARNVFTDISREDQNCAMAYWGIGMSYYNGFANSIDLNGGRSALQRAQYLAMANKTTRPSPLNRIPRSERSRFRWHYRGHLARSSPRNSMPCHSLTRKNSSSGIRELRWKTHVLAG